MIALLLKVTAVFLFAWAAASVARRSAASTRHAILVAAQIVVLLIPILTFMVPPMNVESAAAQQIAAIDRPVRFEPAPAPPVWEEAPVPAIRLHFWMLWPIGAMAIALARVVSYARAAGIVRRAKPFADVLISDEVDQPVTVGRSIVLPQSANEWDEGRLRAVLLHERAHVDRRDSLLAVIGDSATALYWFHPLAWLAARKAMLERERACDETVLARGVPPTAYAGAIVDVARDMVLRRRAAGLAMADRSDLAHRITAILDPTLRRRTTRPARVLVVTAAIVAAPLLAALTPRAGEPDLLNDEFTSPFSERIVIDEIPDVPATGADAALIAEMHRLARLPQRHDIDFVAYRARWALTQVRDGQLIGPLLEKLNDPDWRVRAYAAFGLAVARDRRATGPLIDLLADRIWRVRAMSSTALANTIDPAAVSAMRRALRDEAWQVRMEAVRYFAAIGAHRDLFERMKHDRHAAVRAAAEEALR